MLNGQYVRELIAAAQQKIEAMMNTLMGRMVALMMARMSNEAKDAMMEKFLPGQSTDDRENLIKEMMLHCLSMMLPHVSKKSALILFNFRPSYVSS